MRGIFWSRTRKARMRRGRELTDIPTSTLFGHSPSRPLSAMRFVEFTIGRYGVSRTLISFFRRPTRLPMWRF